MRCRRSVWLVRAGLISLIIHAVLFFPVEKLPRDADVSSGTGAARINASLSSKQPQRAVTNASAEEPRSISSLAHGRRPTLSEKGLPTIFGGNEQYTAAVKKTRRDEYVEPIPAALETLEGIELGTYRIAVARVLRRYAGDWLQPTELHVPYELVLELRFIKPMSPPLVSILKSSGATELDRKFLEVMTQVAAELPMPVEGRQLPYRVELPIWIKPEER